MFDFEKLQAYHKAKAFNRRIKKDALVLKSLDRDCRDQLKRASRSIVLNIAESTSRFSDPDKRNFYVIARGSLFECIAVLDELKDDLIVTEELYLELYANGEEISKMLFVLINGLGKKHA